MTAPWPRIHPPLQAGPMLGSSPRLLDMGDNSSLLTPPFATIVSALSRLKSVPSYFHPFTSTINIELNIYWDFALPIISCIQSSELAAFIFVPLWSTWGQRIFHTFLFQSIQSINIRYLQRFEIMFYFILKPNCIVLHQYLYFSAMLITHQNSEVINNDQSVQSRAGASPAAGAVILLTLT